MRVAVTGATGFLGSRLLPKLLSEKWKVRCLTRKPTDFSKLGVEKIAGDINQRASLYDLAADVDVVIHLAALAHKGAGQTPANDFFQINAEGTKTLVECCASQDKSPFLIFVSSSAVYGKTEGKVSENSVCNPITAYGKSKLEAEEFMRREIERGAIRGCILRPSTVFGDYAPGNLSRLASLIRKGILPLLGDGTNRKSLTHVNTVVDVCTLIAQKRDALNGKIFNVTDNDSYTMQDIGLWVAKALQRHPRIIHLPKGAALTMAASTDKLLHALLLRDFHWKRIIEVYSDSDEFSNQSLREALDFNVVYATPLILPYTLF